MDRVYSSTQRDHESREGRNQEITRKRIAILISGRGSNMAALADAIQNGAVPNAQVVLVVSDQATAAGLQLAREREIATAIIERSGRSRAEHEREIIATLQKYNVDLICLAGYMRLLSSCFVQAYPQRILNIHPSLLPSFPGLDAQRQAIEHGVKWTGCTVHLVDTTLDGGPIIAQRAVAVLDDDTEATLSKRLLAEEHLLYPEALSLIVSGNYQVVGRRVLRKN
ncbi:MAG TPA: phosphoribosylglycinamide formyltransferase [Pyrinomonadaceae bacterium]|nr:phosphoribosylglycinamide formyltransferase [Pyrinomonadaceae bacterium]